jgi:hypothetical protein
MKKDEEEGQVALDPYTEEDVIEGIWLVNQEDFSIKRTALFTDRVKKNVAQRMTLSLAAGVG